MDSSLSRRLDRVPKIVRWSDLADDPTYHTEIGYSRKQCERWWLVVQVHTAEIESWCGDHWIISDLDDTTLLYDHRTASEVASGLSALVLNLSDYWRIGEVQKPALRHPSSQAVVDQLSAGGRKGLR